MPELTEIIDLVYGSPVFGDSFIDEEIDRQAVVDQFTAVAGHYVHGLTKVVTEGSPDLGQGRLQELVGRLAITCVGFGAGLSAGEINDNRMLGDLAVLIGTTGWANWLPTEDGDVAMVSAIQGLNGDDEKVKLRSRGLGYIDSLTAGILRSEDVATSVGVSRELVHHGMVAHRLSTLYRTAREAGRGSQFLGNSDTSNDIAESLIITGALPSAVAPLYGIYRHDNPEWPELAKVHSESEIFELQRVVNAFVRYFDDKGDRGVDARAFSLNLFNQPHPKLVEAFLRRACVDSQAVINELVEAIADVGDSEVARRLDDFFVTHVNERVSGLSERTKREYQGYINLCKRGVEAAYVNEMGYEALTSGTINN